MATLTATVLLAAAASTIALPPAEPPEHPFLTFERPRDYVVEASVLLRSPQVDDGEATAFGVFSFDQASFVYPTVRASAASRSLPEDVTATIRVADQDVIAPLALLDGYAADSQYIRFQLGGAQFVRDIFFATRHSHRAWRTELNEDAAASAVWPDAYPPLVATALSPTLGVDDTPQDQEALAAALGRYTRGNDPRSIPPFTLAKFLLGRVTEEIANDSDGFLYASGVVGASLERSTFSGLQGFQLRGPAHTLETRRGNRFEVAALLSGLYRAAGLPARVVISLLEPDDSERDDQDAADDRGFDLLRTHVEFYLHDPETNTGGWIPADPVRLRRASSRVPDLARSWPYLGTHDELERRIPLAFHFHPPTTVRSFGAPALYGMISTPVIPETAVQSINFTASSLPRTADTMWRYREPYTDPNAPRD